MAEDKLDRIENKIDKIVDRIGSIDVTVAKQQVSLDEHIARTNILEDEIRPIKKHVDIVNFLGKIALAVICSDIGYEALRWLLKIHG